MNQGEISSRCAFISLNNAYFNSQCLSNVKRLFSARLSQKKHDQLRFDRKFYQDEVLVSFTATLPNITTDIRTGKQIYSTSLSKRKGFSTKTRS